MTQTDTAPAAEERFEPPTLRGFVAAHKRGSAAVVAVVVVLVSAVVVADLGARVTRVTDSTPCSVWASATQHERSAYAGLYVREHGPLSSGGSDSGSIERAADAGCEQAYAFDEADSVDVLQAIRQQY